MTDEEIYSLIEGCRARGVLHLKVQRIAESGFDQIVEFTLTPSLPASDPFAELSKPLDPNKCQQCQASPRDGKIAGLCRVCSLSAAGVTS
jgi:hypothetical protein